jgi:dTDP-4-amino-4,6-dideoxygalactose transaminase
MNIPFVDLKAQYQSIKIEIDIAIRDIIEKATFIGGESIKNFEKQFSEWSGIKHIMACANGTDAIEIALQVLGIGKGDEVIVPAISWISTSEAVSNTGAKPIFVDIEKDFYTLNPELIESKITPHTKAIIPVHLYGQMANMPLIMEIAQKYNLRVIEDCAQAHGTKLYDKPAGSWGDIATFSFYPGKNLGAYGDAGAIGTNNPKWIEKIRRICNHGQISKHDHQIEGRNSRLDSLQAAVLCAKLPHLTYWNQQRLQHALYYNDLFKNISNIITPSIRADSSHVFHLYVIRTQERDKLAQYLKENGIQTAIHYPIALPFLPCYAHYQHNIGDFPIASSYQHQILSLPMYAEITEEMQNYVVDRVLNYKF